MASSTTLKLDEQVHQTIAPKSVPPRAPRRRWPRFLLALVLVLAIVGAVVFGLSRRTTLRSEPGGPAAPAAYAPATRGKLMRTLRIGGVVAAVHFAGVAAPSLRGGSSGGGGFGGGGGGPQMSVVSVATAGSRVKPGDLLAEFERQAQQNNFLDRQAEFISLTDQIAKRRAELDIERGQRQTEILKARTDMDGARLENKRNEVISKIDAEKNQQALAEAEATLKMLEQTQKLRLAAAEAELKVLEIRRERERLQMEHARMNFDRLVVKASIPGMVVLTPIWKGNQMGIVQEGDQVRPGVVFLQVVDSTTMIVRARVNQVDAGLLRQGMPGEVRLDAYPDMKFSGKVESMSTLAQAPGWWTRYVKTFPIVFSIQGSDPRLIPDISASFDAEIEQAPDAVLAPRGAVVLQAGSNQAGFVWVKEGDEVKARSVTLGPKNDTHWVIKSGLKENEIVALYPPKSAAENSGGKSETKPSADQPQPKASGTPEAGKPKAAGTPEGGKPKAAGAKGGQPNAT